MCTVGLNISRDDLYVCTCLHASNDAPATLPTPTCLRALSRTCMRDVNCAPSGLTTDAQYDARRPLVTPIVVVLALCSTHTTAERSGRRNHVTYLRLSDSESETSSTPLRQPTTSAPAPRRHIDTSSHDAGATSTSQRGCGRDHHFHYSMQYGWSVLLS